MLWQEPGGRFQPSGQGSRLSGRAAATARAGTGEAGRPALQSMPLSVAQSALPSRDMRRMLMEYS
jgi:hypothetical protein